jgi:hypothetical protein
VGLAGMIAPAPRRLVGFRELEALPVIRARTAAQDGSALDRLVESDAWPPPAARQRVQKGGGPGWI